MLLIIIITPPSPVCPAPSNTGAKIGAPNQRAGGLLLLARGHGREKLSKKNLGRGKAPLWGIAAETEMGHHNKVGGVSASIRPGLERRGQTAAEVPINAAARASGACPAALLAEERARIKRRDNCAATAASQQAAAPDQVMGRRDPLDPARQCLELANSLWENCASWQGPRKSSKAIN